MIRLLAVFTFIAALSAPAFAQNTSKNACDLLFAEPAYRVLLGNPNLRALPDGCEMTQGKYDNYLMGWMFEKATIHGTDLVSALLQKNLPVAGQIQIDSARTMTGKSHLLDYVMSINQEPGDTRFAYEWDEKSKVLSIKEASIRNEFMGKATLSAELGLPFLPKTDFKKLPEINEITLHKASLIFENKYMFQFSIMPMIVYSFSDTFDHDEDPRPKIEEYRSQVITFIEALPDNNIDEASKKAMQAFVQNIPKPKGILRLALEFDPPLSEKDVNGALDILAINRLFQKVKIEAQYDPNASTF